MIHNEGNARHGHDAGPQKMVRSVQNCRILGLTLSVRLCDDTTLTMLQIIIPKRAG